MLRIQSPLPEGYTGADPDDLAQRIGAAKAALGDRVFILGHHYQRDEVMRWADARGDSFRLSVLAQQRADAEFIVFCGVHFMRFLCGREPDQDATFVADATDEIPVVTESKQYAGAEPRLDPCPLCRGTQGALLFRLPFEQVWGPHSIDRHGEFLSLYRCRSCALEWFSPVGAGSGQLYADMPSVRVSSSTRP